MTNVNDFALNLRKENIKKHIEENVAVLCIDGIFINEDLIQVYPEYELIKSCSTVMDKTIANNLLLRLPTEYDLMCFENHLGTDLEDWYTPVHNLNGIVYTEDYVYGGDYSEIVLLRELAYRHGYIQRALIEPNMRKEFSKRCISYNYQDRKIAAEIIYNGVIEQYGSTSSILSKIKYNGYP